MQDSGNGMVKESVQKIRRKPGRVPTSCAECRRLKLRCDKKIPCEKCVSRGCGSICPDGSLTPGKGNRLVLANTEELHDKIEALCTRIRELESALRTLQSSVSSETHPLLKKDVLQQPAPSNSQQIPLLPVSSRQIPSQPPGPVNNADSHSTSIDDDNFVDAFGTLTLGSGGEYSFFGNTARAEYLIHARTQPRFRTNFVPPRLSKRMVQPIFPEVEISDPELGQEIFSMLPTPSEAIRLCGIYQEHGKYMYTPVPQTELINEILFVVYRADSTETPSRYHSLSLLLIIFAIATLFDPNHQPYSIEAQEYYYLARTALGINPQTTQLSIQALIHIAQYLEFSDCNSTGSNSTWTYIGYAVRLGHSIGLHLNSVRWKLSEDNVQRRCRLFWQLFVLDTWASFCFGRPPTMSALYIDCSFPQDVDETTSSDGEEGMSFHSWNWQYTALVHSIMTTAFGPKAPAYAVILSLDSKVRDFPVPSIWRPVCRTPDELASTPLELHMRRWLVLSNKESTLLNLHRAYFVQALQEKPMDLANHRYMPSVIAIYRSAWRLIEGLRLAWRGAPHPLSRTSLAWSQALSAAVVLCLLATRAPNSNMAPHALAELDVLLQLFQDAATRSRIAASIIDSIHNLHQKAHEVMDHIPPHGTITITPTELDRLAGKTYLLAEIDTSGTGNTEPSRPVMTGISSEYFLDLNTDTMHPSIALDMRNFDTGAPSFHDLFDFPTTSLSQPTIPDPCTSENISYPAVNYHAYQSPPAPAPPNNIQSTIIYDQPAPMLDSAWHSFAEQLGF